MPPFAAAESDSARIRADWHHQVGQLERGNFVVLVTRTCVADPDWEDTLSRAGGRPRTLAPEQEEGMKDVLLRDAHGVKVTASHVKRCMPALRLKADLLTHRAFDRLGYAHRTISGRYGQQEWPPSGSPVAPQWPPQWRPQWPPILKGYVLRYKEGNTLDSFIYLYLSNCAIVAKTFVS